MCKQIPVKPVALHVQLALQQLLTSAFNAFNTTVSSQTQPGPGCTLPNMARATLPMLVQLEHTFTLI